MQQLLLLQLLVVGGWKQQVWNNEFLLCSKLETTICKLMQKNPLLALDS